MWIETQRLILREFQKEDRRELAPMLADLQVMKFSPTGVISIAQTQERIESFITCYKEFGFGKWAVILKRSSELIGYCGMVLEKIGMQYKRTTIFHGVEMDVYQVDAVTYHSNR